ncbi:hypothetical protein GGD41_001196 [Paraburkholderia bryophila]|uniref:CNP1-like uncharacterized domain-containing protein n=1 Tax=Paraburkholderia bryophila TaxID=420952 RepID=A0A7Z0AYQ4_9BURK|nr:hypothetical protein [Paraburkholderia bryophila]
MRLSWPPQPARLTEPRRCFEEIILKALALVVACVATGALLAGCSSAGKPTNKDDSAFVYLLDRQGSWVENKVDTLPPLPQDANLLPFAVSGNTPLQFAVDKNSLTVGTDGVVRLTVVVTSPSGARNVIYEGIRCDTYEWRQYAGPERGSRRLGHHGREQFHAYRGRCAERVSVGAVPRLSVREQDAYGQRSADS